MRLSLSHLSHRANEAKSENIVAIAVEITDDIFIREYALDNTPVLHLSVVQHEYLMPPHTLRKHVYVSVGHVDEGRACVSGH